MPPKCRHVSTLACGALLPNAKLDFRVNDVHRRKGLGMGNGLGNGRAERRRGHGKGMTPPLLF